MASIYSMRNKNHCLTFLVFQVIFVAIQVFVFYPCWQRAPQSTIFRSYRADKQVQTQPLEQPVAPRGKSSAHIEPVDTVKKWIDKGMDIVKRPSNTEFQESQPQTAQGQEQQQNQPASGQQQQLQQQQQHQQQQEQEKQNSNFNVDGVKAAAGKVFDAVKTRVGQLGLGTGTTKAKPPLTAEQIAAQKVQQQNEQLKQEQNEKEGAQLRGQQVKMQESEVQKASQQNLLASKLRYNTTWESLDSRPNPAWYDAAKIGIFLHWGVYSVPSFSVSNGLAEWFWFYWKSKDVVRPMDEYHAKRFERFLQKHGDAIKGVEDFALRMYGPKWRYTDFAPQFKAEMFDSKHWANMFVQSGAKYVILTSKHHDGFTLWPSRKSWNWNSVDVGPHRDLVGELGKAVRDAGLKYGLYHSLYEWFNPKYIEDKKNGFTTQTFVNEKMMPELKALVNTYRPDIVWSDGQFEAPCSYWNCTDFLAWLYNDSPVRDDVVTNDRWGTDVLCKHGGYLTCADRYNPKDKMSRKWENCMTVDRESWGYRRNAHLDDYYTIEGLLELLAQTVSKGGNLLVNVGPTADGRIAPIFEERLTQMGKWLSVNGEAIYGTTSWSTTTDPNNNRVYYTQKSSQDGPLVFALVASWPQDDKLVLIAPNPSTQTTVTWVGYRGEAVPWQKGTNGGMILTLPRVSMTQIPCQWIWVFKITKLLNAVV